MGVEYKTVDAVITKAEEDGSFEAKLGVLSVLDKDNDIPQPGMFKGHPVMVLPAHSQQHVPLGKAKIIERGGSFYAAGKLNLDIPAARDWHSALKFDLANISPPIQQWSWGFSVMSGGAEVYDQNGKQVRSLKSVDEREVSPVLRGSGLDTGTLNIKSEGEGTSVHKAETSDALWDGLINERLLLKTPITIDTANKAYAWISEEFKDEKAVNRFNCKLFHHFTNDEGELGAASVRACITGIATINGSRGAINLSVKERNSVYEHLAGHIKDANTEPPKLHDVVTEVGIRLKDQVQLATWEVEAAIARLQQVSSGRELGTEAKTVAITMAKQHAAMAMQLKELVEGMLPEDDIARLAANFLATEAKLSGL